MLHNETKLSVFDINCADSKGKFDVNPNGVSTAGWAIGISAAVLALPTGILNTIAFLVLVISKKLNKPCYVFIAFLSASDALSGFALMPFLAILMLRESSEITCGYIVPSSVIAFVVLGMTVSGMILISTDRYMAIFHPYVYSEWFTMRITRSVCFVLFLYNSAVGIGSMFIHKKKLFTYSFTGLLFIALPWNFFVHVSIYRLTKQIQKRNPHERANGKTVRQKRLVRTLFIIFLCMVLSHIPYAALTATVKDFGKAKSAVKALYLLGMLMLLGNSFLNPILYCWNLTIMRSEMSRLFLGRTREKEASSAYLAGTASSQTRTQ